jgi:lipoate-protein ligase A
VLLATGHWQLATDYNGSMADEWRLVISPAASGPRNMAVDEAILESVAAGQVSPTVRLYAWQPPCLSLGHAQSAAVVDPEALAAHGWGLVRRPTGDAVLHADELTYAVVAPIDTRRWPAEFCQLSRAQPQAARRT